MPIVPGVASTVGKASTVGGTTDVGSVSTVGTLVGTLVAAVVGLAGASVASTVAATVGLASTVAGGGAVVAVAGGGAVVAVAGGGAVVAVAGIGVGCCCTPRQKYMIDWCWLDAPCTVSAHLPGNRKKAGGRVVGAKSTRPSDAAQHSGWAVPTTPPPGSVNQNDTSSFGVKPVAVKVTTVLACTNCGSAVPSTDPEGSQAWA
jgi:hypothetical protein